MLVFLFLSFIATTALLFFIVPVLKRNLLDHPNERSSHAFSTPRGGGLSFVLVSSGSCIFALWNGQNDGFLQVFMFAFFLAIAGFLDDIFDLPVSWRYVIQLITSFCIIAVSPLFDWIKVFSFSYHIFFSCAFLLIALIAVTAIINFVNFMDGLDGLISGCFSVSIVATALVFESYWILWVLVGSLIAFLFWNWSPAKLFMGDVGSTYLGAILAGSVLQSPTFLDAFVLIIVSLPLLGDACTCVLRRFLAGHRVFKAHRLHLFQRLHQAGWSHTRVSLAYIGATLLLALAMLSGNLYFLFFLAVVVVSIGFWLDQRVAVAFSVASDT